MATDAEWSLAYARQADADFCTFQLLQTLSVPECHRLQFLQMACSGHSFRRTLRRGNNWRLLCDSAATRHNVIAWGNAPGIEP